MDIKGFIVDQVGHFAVQDILNVAFSVVVASMLTLLLARFGGGVKGKEARQLLLWSATSALGVGFVKAQLPLALALVAIAILVGAPREEGGSRLLTAGALVIGLGCGSGASLVTIILALPYVLLVRWASSVRELS